MSERDPLLADNPGSDSDSASSGLKSRVPRKRSRRLSSARDGHADGDEPNLNIPYSELPPLAYALVVLFVGLVGAIVYLARTSWIHSPPPRYNGTLAFSPPYYPSPLGGSDPAWADAYQKAAEIVDQMTLVEKVNVTTGVGWAGGFCVGNTGQVGRLGVPSLCLQDGPMGIRFADNVTAFPAAITLGMTWNRALMRQKAHAHGAEARGKGINVLLGPAVGALGRTPYGGRNWEGFGSDPFIQGVGATEMVTGIQAEGVIATIKHLVANEQEHFRRGGPEWADGAIISEAISSNIDDRTMHELYLWPFADAVRAGVGSAMCGYNQINNSYGCQNSMVMNGLLKDELGFQGFIQSDWQAQRSGVGSAHAGLDMTMPGDGLVKMDGKALWGPHLTNAVLNGTVPMERVNDMVLRILASWIRMGQHDKDKWPLPPPDGDGGPNFSSWTHDREGWWFARSPDRAWGVVNKHVNVQADHARLARRIAAEGTVLLKNTDRFLPLDRAGRSQDGHAKVRPKDRAQTRIGIFGDDAEFTHPPRSCHDYACHTGSLIMGWGSGTVEPPYVVSPLQALKARLNQDHVRVTAHLSQTLPEDDVLSEQDVCLVFVRANAGEGYLSVDDIRGDRNHLLPLDGGAELVAHVADRCANTVVVVHSVGPIIMDPWFDLESVKAIVWANLPGQESGNALADVLFGDINPSGKLTYTIAKRESDYGPSAEILKVPQPGTGPGSLIGPQQNFSEGLYIDYRHFDKHGIEPRYEFGFGLSYTSFDILPESVRLEQTDEESRRRADTAPRPVRTISPPKVNTTIPNPGECLPPRGFKYLRGYVYPWIDPQTFYRLLKRSRVGRGRESSAKTAGSVPAGGAKTDAVNRSDGSTFGDGASAVLSPAGGGPGGNPDIWTTVTHVRGRVKNTGSRAGATVVQVYVSLPRTDEPGPDSGPESIEMPVRVLRGFDKSGELAPGAEFEFDVPLTRRDLSYWSVRRQNWVLPEGEIAVQVGFSSRDLKWVGKL